MKLISWNVNGLRAVQKKGFADFVKKQKPDILCLQETKIGKESLDKVDTSLRGYNAHFSSAVKPGYSGVATYFKEPHLPKDQKMKFGINEKHFDDEGRFLISEHDDFLLYNIYFPSGTSGEVRQDFKYKFLDKLLSHFKALPKAKRDKLIICGDYNICHKEIDIHHPEKAEKLELSGFLPDERKWMDKFASAGFVDTYRHINGEKKGVYSWWSYRAGARKKNLGWRIDYFFVAEKLAKKVKNAKILTDVEGSDHCPIVLELH